MSPDPATLGPASSELPAVPAGPPAWVDLLLEGARVSSAGAITIAHGRSFASLTARIAGAGHMSVATLQAAVTTAYASLGDALRARHLHPVRFWNFIPAPDARMGPGLDRYMVFNAGRYGAYASWFAGAHGFGHRLATGSAVGVDGDDLTIVCLGSVTPGTPVENPRQTPSWQYSVRYGPRPPCFARATRVSVDGRPLALIGGTASIVGEDSCHAGDVAAQVRETLSNLRAVVAAADGRSAPAGDELARLTDVRIYVPRARDAQPIRAAVSTHCAGDARLEVWRSQLCRPELLVEIEGVAAL